MKIPNSETLVLTLSLEGKPPLYVTKHRISGKYIGYVGFDEITKIGTADSPTKLEAKYREMGK